MGVSEGHFRNGMVTSSHYLASEAGRSILEQGGNAVDAAVATSLALNVALPHMCSIGGEGRALISMRGADEKVVVDWAGRSSKKASADMYEVDRNRRVVTGPSVPLTGYAAAKDDANHTGYRSAMVPGSIAGYAAALERFGTMSFATVVEPAIRIAAEGVPLTGSLAFHLGQNVDRLSKDGASKAIFLEQGVRRTLNLDGHSVVIVQEDLARTLRTLAVEGPDSFYRGSIAEKIVSAMRANGGFIDEDDLGAYHPEFLQPSCGTFRGHETFGVPGGGTSVVEILNILDGFDIEVGQHQTPETLHLFAEAVRLAFGDRVRFISGDFDHVPWKGLCSREHAAKLREQIDPRRATPMAVEPTSDPWYYNGDTTHLCVIDGQGNSVSSTITIGAAFGASVVVPGTGILLNALMHSFNPEAGDINSVGPWKRRRTPHAASLVTRDGVPQLIVGSPGGEKQIVATSQVILNVLVGRMPIQAAIDAPRLFRGLRDDVYVTDDMPDTTIEALEGLGHLVHKKDRAGFGFGRPNGITVENHGGLSFEGGVDKTTEGRPAGL